MRAFEVSRLVADCTEKFCGATKFRMSLLAAERAVCEFATLLMLCPEVVERHGRVTILAFRSCNESGRHVVNVIK